MSHVRVYAFSSRATPDGWDLRDVLQPAIACVVDDGVLESPQRAAQGLLAAPAHRFRTLQLHGAEGVAAPFATPLARAPFEVDSLLLAAEPVGGAAACVADDARLGLLFVGWADGLRFTAARRDVIVEPRWAAFLFACASRVNSQGICA